MSNSDPLRLSRRERQLIEVVYRLGEATVTQALEGIEDPPSYSSVRALLNELVRKKQLTIRQDGKRYLYLPKKPREGVAKRLLANLVSNFFQGKPSQAICALLEDSKLTEEELDLIKQRIAQAKESKQ